MREYELFRRDVMLQLASALSLPEALFSVEETNYAMSPRPMPDLSQEREGVE